MNAGSPQETWLRNDLAASAKSCTLAYWHRPIFTSGAHGPDASTRPLFQALYDRNAELVITGHNHHYERFAPMNPTGSLDNTRGIRQFVVGTGGAGLSAFGTIQPNSQARNSTAYGVLKLTLRSGVSGRTIAILVTEVTLAVNERITHIPFLRQANHGVIYGSITVRVILTQHFPYNTG